MDELSSQQTSGGRFATSEQATASGTQIRHIAACLDRSTLAERILAHVVAVAQAFNARVSLLHVLDTLHRADVTLTDPLEWELARREANAYLEQVAEQHAAHCDELSVELIEGEPSVQIGKWVCENNVDLVVLCTHGHGGATDWPLASTARKLVECLPCSLLVIPAATEHRVEPLTYARVLVPLDGSIWSETALTLATRLARAHHAEMILAHAVPRPELTRVGLAPPSTVDLEFERRLAERNESIGREYLEQQRARLGATGIPARAVLACNGDIRAALLGVITREDPDIVVLSTCGSSGHPGHVAGTVAMHLLTHATRPLLLARPQCGSTAESTRPRHRAAFAPRLPTQATR